MQATLHRLGLASTHTGLYANHITPRARAALQKRYAPLLPYVKGPQECGFLSSFRREHDAMTFHLDAAASDSATELMAKIPRGVPITDIGWMSDGISWYGESQGEAVYRQAPYPVARQSFDGYYSNHGIVYKTAVCGQKYTPVELMIERFVEGDALRPLPPVFKQLCESLGKPKRRERHCVFAQEEETRWRDSNDSLRASVDLHAADSRFAVFDTVENDNVHTRIAKLAQELQPLTGFSPKAVCQKAAKAYGFRYVSFAQGTYRFETITAHGHRFLVEIVIPPLTSYVFMHQRVQGWNVDMSVIRTPQAVIGQETTFAAYVQEAFAVAAETAARFAETLPPLFGETPRWFWDCRESAV